MRARCAMVVGLCVGLVAGMAHAQPEKFSLSMFHFNVQYVAGGLEGYPSGDDDRDVYDLDDAEVQDLIIVESFEPVLDLFLAHPDWKVTLEMQAYMVEIMLERHPGVLAKLKQLVDAGQAELVSFHWSDQLFLAYPRRDMAASHRLMDPVWEQAGLSPSPVVFCQEGQFGVGMLAFGAARGRQVFVLPKNLFRYQHLGDYETAPPLYTRDGVDVIIGSRSFATDAVQVSWNFFDDGELLATGGAAPYIGKDFVADPAAVAEYEQELAALATDGWRIATIGEFVDWAKANGIEPEPLPPVLDGTWQPPSTDSMHRWMGAAGLVDSAFGGERDNAVLSGNVRARHRIAAAETLVAHLEQQGALEPGSRDDALAECWREVLLAQVSDASGINPFVGEVRYGLNHAAAGQACAEALLEELAPQVGGPVVLIDTGSGEVGAIDDQPGELASEAASPFPEAASERIAAAGRPVETRWERVGGPEGEQPGRWRLTVSIGPPDEPGPAAPRTATAAFPLALDGFYLTPGLVEDDAVFHPFSAFDLQEGRIALPVANGLIGLDEQRWLIKETRHVHLAAIFEPGTGEVRFEDQTLPPDAGVEWVFWVVDGDEQTAVELADRLNLHPLVWWETGVESGRGCGCGAGRAAGGRPAGLLGLLALLGLARRRRPRTGLSP